MLCCRRSQRNDSSPSVLTECAHLRTQTGELLKLNVDFKQFDWEFLFRASAAIPVSTDVLVR